MKSRIPVIILSSLAESKGLPRPVRLQSPHEQSLRPRPGMHRVARVSVSLQHPNESNRGLRA